MKEIEKINTTLDSTKISLADPEGDGVGGKWNPLLNFVELKCSPMKLSKNSRKE